MSETPGRYQRSFTGLIASVLVVVLALLGYWLLKGLVSAPTPAPARNVDYAPAVAYARDVASFEVLAPERLPEGWRATSVSYREPPRERWHLGLVTDTEQYVGLEQEPRSAETMVETYVDAETATRGEPVRVDGPWGMQTWRTWTDADGDTALTLRRGETTVLVVGTADLSVLVAFLQSLH